MRALGCPKFCDREQISISSSSGRCSIIHCMALPFHSETHDHKLNPLDIRQCIDMQFECIKMPNQNIQLIVARSIFPNERSSRSDRVEAPYTPDRQTRLVFIPEYLLMYDMHSRTSFFSIPIELSVITGAAQASPPMEWTASTPLPLHSHSHSRTRDCRCVSYRLIPFPPTPTWNCWLLLLLC